MTQGPWTAPQLVELNGEPTPIDALPRVTPQPTPTTETFTERVPVEGEIVIPIDGEIMIEGKRYFWLKTDGVKCLSYQEKLRLLPPEEAIMWLFIQHIVNEQLQSLDYEKTDVLGLEGVKALQAYVGKRNAEHKAIEIDKNTIRVGERIFSLGVLQTKFKRVSSFLAFQSRFPKKPAETLKSCLPEFFGLPVAELTFWECQSLINFLFSFLAPNDSEESPERDPEDTPE